MPRSPMDQRAYPVTTVTGVYDQCAALPMLRAQYFAMATAGKPSTLATPNGSGMRSPAWSCFAKARFSPAPCGPDRRGRCSADTATHPRSAPTERTTPC